MTQFIRFGTQASKQTLLAVLILVFSFFPYGQYMFSGLSFGPVDSLVAYAAGDGSVGAPFTDLFSVYVASQQGGFTAGTYNFDIDGNTFSSYVDTDGWVAVASADNTQLNGVSYPEVTALTLNSDTVLDRDILAAAEPDALRMVSVGAVAMDRVTTEQRYLDRLRNFTTLGSDGGNDNTDWAGTGGSINGGISAALGTPLNEVLWHSTGVASALHWFPGGAGSQEDGFGSQVNTTETTLYMRDTSPNVTPGGVADDLVLWVKADEGGTAWTDQSGSITTVTPAGTPTLNANSLNFNDQVSFNGSSRYNLTNAGFVNGTGDKAIYVVGSRNTNTGATYALTIGSGSPNRFASFGHWTNFPNDPFISTSGFEVTSNNGSWPINTSALVGYALDGGSDQLYTNGASLGIAQDDVSLDVTNGNLGWIGAFNNGGAQWNGDIAEVIVYNQSTDSNTDRQQIESYLALKYGMTLDAAVEGYVNSDGVSVYELGLDASFTGAEATDNTGGNGSPDGGTLGGVLTIPSSGTYRFTHSGNIITNGAGAGFGINPVPFTNGENDTALANEVTRGANLTFSSSADRIDSTTPSKTYSLNLVAGDYYVGFFSGGSNATSDHTLVVTRGNTYIHNIVGIARDDLTALDQRISKSVNTDTVLTITTDENVADFTSSNGGSREQLADGDYVVLGSNGAATTLVPTSISGYVNKIDRQWRAEVTNYTGDVHAKFDIADISGSNWDLVQSDTSDFADAGANLTKVADVPANGELSDVTLVDGKYYGLLEEGTLVAPGGVTSDLALWLKADVGLTANGSNEVTDWNEQSNARTETINGTPILISNGINFNPWVEFDPGTAAGGSTASTDWIDWPNFTSGYTEGQAYIVMEHDNDPAAGQFHGGFWGLGEETVLWIDGRIYEAFGYNVSGADRSIFNPTQPFDEPLVYSAAIDDSTNSARTIRIDGLQVNSKNNTDVDFGTQPISLGRTNLNSLISSNRGFGGRIAEFIVFSSDQDSPNEEQVESYLALKYGVTLDSSVESYKNSAGADVYDLTPEQTFTFDFGGTDNGGASAPSGRGGAANTFTLTEPATANITHSGASISGNAGIGISTTILPDAANPVAASDAYTTTGDRIDATTSSKNYSTSLAAGTYYVGVFSGGGSSAASHNVTISVDNIASYEENIVGIARDDASGLDQQISKSINDDAILTLSIDTNFTDANGTHTSLDDGQFVVVGSNGLATTAQQTELPADTTDGLSREWRLENTGSVAGVNMKFDGFDDSWVLYSDSDGDFGADARQVGTLNANGEITVTLGPNGTTEIDDGEFFTLAQTAAAVDIAGVSGGLTLWLDADDASTVFQNQACTGQSVAGESAATTGDVGCWLDKSGQNNHVSVLTDEAREPLYIDSALNGKNVLDFQGDSLVTAKGNQITSNTSYTKFAVFRYDTATPYNNIISSASNAGGGHAFFGGVGRSNLALFHGGTFNEVVGQPGIGKYTVGTGRYGAPDSLTNVTNVNGVESAVSTNARNFNGTHRTEIGSVFGGGFGLDGHLAEAIVFDRALTDAEIDEVECYLATKWDIPISNDSPNCVVTLATVEFSAAAGVSTDETTNDNFVELLVSGTTTAVATVDVSVIGGTASTGSDYIFTNPTTVTIPVGTYDGTSATAVVVPVPTLPGDSVAEGNETVIFSLTNPTGEAVLGDANGNTTDVHTFSYTITDDDNAAIMVSTPNNLTSESGPGAAVVALTLASQPTHPVMVTIDILGLADQSEAKLNFTGAPVFTTTTTIAPADWNTPQLVLIYGLDDVVDDGNQNVTVVTSGSTSTDPNYNLAGTAIADVVIVNQDDDISDIVVSTSDNETSEDGDTATVTLTPSSAPTEEVLVPVTITDLTEGSVVESSVVLAAGVLIPVDVVITGVDDTELDIDMSYQIIFGDPISVDAAYDALTATDVANQNLVNLDNDDIDNDGNPDSTENAGNNGGDGNGDGTPDAQQSDVSGVPNPLTGDYTTIEATGGCTFITENAAVAEGSLAAQDPSFEYPVGLVDFQIQCATPGDSADVTIYYGQQYDTSTWNWRKFNSVGVAYSDISSAVTYGTATLGTTTVTTATFTVTDGDPQTDEDGVADGIINDPSGPAITVTTTSTSSGGGNGGSFNNRVCKDPTATNYEKVGISSPSKCEYEEEEGEKPATVVDASTSICSPYLTQTIALNRNNDKDEVEKLQNFLNDRQGESLPVDGIYNQDDFEAVKRFQLKYKTEVLDIWGLTEPTGYVYLTTRNKINSFYCSAAIECPYFTQFNSTTENNNSNEVLKTKILMSELGFYTGPLDEAWGTDMKTAMIKFQETFKATMLTPWGLTKGTGYKYKTTNRFLNNLVGCKLPAETLENGVTVSY